MTRTVPIAIGMAGALDWDDADAGPPDASAAPDLERPLRARCAPLVSPAAFEFAVAFDADDAASATLAFASAAAAVAEAAALAAPALASAAAAGADAAVVAPFAFASAAAACVADAAALASFAPAFASAAAAVVEAAALPT